MISPNYSVIMETTSTTSSYNTLERNPHTERMLSNVGDSADGLIENELLEERNQDPEDEDTLSDDSLRLRLSDDEAEPSQPRSRDVSAAPHVSSEETTSQDTAMGVTDSDEKVPINSEIKSSINKSGRPASNKESQKSKHRSQILSETRVGGKKNITGMWRGGNRREPSSNKTIHSSKRSLRGHSLHVGFNHSHSNIHKIPSYFNNHDNFGRPPGYRRYGSNWRHLKGKYLQNSTRNVRTKQCSANEKAEGPSVVGAKKPTDSLPSVNDELSRECSHLNLDKESNLDIKSCENFSSNHSDWKDRENMPGYDSQFTSDNWFDEPYDNCDKPTLCSETSSPLLSQGSSEFQGVGSTSPVQDTESTVPSEQKNDTATDETPPPLPQSSDPSSIDLAKATTESDTSTNSNYAVLVKDTEPDVPPGNQTEVNTNGLDSDVAKESNGLDDSSVSPKDHESEVKPGEVCAVAVVAHSESEEMEILEHQSNDIDETKGVEGKKEVFDENRTKQGVSEEKITNNTEKTESEPTDILPSNGEEVAEQPMEIVLQDKNAIGDRNTQGKESIVADDTGKASLENQSEKEAHCLPEKTTAVKNVGENVRKISVCNETSDKSCNDSELKVAEKCLSKPISHVQTEPPPLVMMKRSLPDAETAADKMNRKKMKVTDHSVHGVCPKTIERPMTTVSPGDEKSLVAEKSQEASRPLRFVRKFFQRDMKGKLAKMKREDLEEFILQKLVETITMRSEIGRLREQARISERNQEATRVRCQQLSKQIKDFGMVLSRNAVDRQSNNDKPVPPIKINRSVGLQVNFVTEHGIQTLKALSSNNAAKPNVPSPVIVNGANTKATAEKAAHTTAIRRGLKVRSPRRAEVTKNAAPMPVQSQTSTATPTALVMSKPPETSHNLSILNNSKEHSLPTMTIAQPAPAKVIQNIIVNGKIAHQVNRQATVINNQKPESNDLIDLTGEEDKHRSGSSGMPGTLPLVGTVTSSIGTKVSHPRLQRVVQATLPANVAITTQPGNIRVVQSVAQPTPTALVNNINTPRLAYLMPSSPGTARQLLIAPNPNQIRPVTSAPRGQYSNLTYKSGISTLANGNVRVITTAAPTIPNTQSLPAPLPDTPHYPNKSGWKLPPPPPSLKISKVAQGIVLSWNMAQSDSYAEIASYQLYAYQEIPGMPPNSNLWKKVGDVRALPLPMACTLKEFTPGNNYHFAVRAVDTHSRLGQYSIPRNISL